ncbi:hypothetical protein [Nocardia vinacea]|uniref:hypothetical protein n=1 Tax=Nocardia vinacea TaxID=96468 RepID=UPI0012F65274|nr:hypothetical protein [Nocardia vinacea]
MTFATGVGVVGVVVLAELADGVVEAALQVGLEELGVGGVVAEDIVVVAQQVSAIG